MSSLLTNLNNKIQFKVHELLVDPEAEAYAAKQRAAEDAAAATAAKKAELEAKETAKKAKEAADTEAAKQRAEQSTFSMKRFLSTSAGAFVSVLIVFLLVAGGIYGASLATNLNVYRTWPYRLLYAIYGFVFFPIVIVYVLGYRWFWQGKRPVFYALLPLIPYYMNRPWMAQFFSWLTYKPDNTIFTLQEWNPMMADLGKEVQAAFYAEDVLKKGSDLP